MQLLPTNEREKMKKPVKPMKERQFMRAAGNTLVCCTVPDFEPSTYKGLKHNCGRPLSDAAKKAQLKKAFLTPLPVVQS